MKICEICDKPFDTRYLVKRHKLQVHKLSSEPLKRGRPNGTGFSCKFCSWSTSSERELRRHINVNHSPRRRRIQIHCPVVNCPYITVTRQELSQHVLHDHSELILEGSSITEMSFDSMTEFKVWKSKEEKDTHSQYILARPPRRCKRASTTVSTYFCHRSGLVRRRGKGMRHMKIQGSCKINTTCPAMLTVHNGESSVRVIYSNVHFGHRREVRHIPLSKEEREQIAGQLALNVPFDTVLRNIRDNLDSKQITRLHLLQRHDLSNITRDFRLDNDKQSPNDVESVCIWIDTLKDQGNECVRFSKFQGICNPEYGLTENDFVLIIMTDVQKEMLVEFGKKVVCIDSTHGTNAYDFSLTTLLVLDEYNEGFPVAFCYSNRTDCNVMKCFFNVVRQSISAVDFPVQILMTDDSTAFYNAWAEVMGAPMNKLLCIWHVDRAWRKNIHSKIHSSQEVKATVYKHIRILLQCEDMDEFHSELNNFLDACESDDTCREFGEYFKKEYASRCDQWAYCYRLGMHINTNMHLEAFHRVLKQVIMKGLRVSRMDKSINAVMKMVKHKVFDRLLKLNKGKLTKAVQHLRQRHKTSLGMCIEDVTVESPTLWNVKSRRTDEVYSVRKEYVTGHSNCPLICPDCKTCIHEYSCTCCDYSLHSTMCKHIHLVLRSANNTKFSEEENEEVHEGSNNVNNDFILNSLKASKSASSAKLEEINSMINELKAKTLDPTIINEPSKVNYIHNNLRAMLGFLSPGTSVKGEHCFPKSKPEPPNKKADKQVRFFSTKKKRRNVQANNLKVPSTEERKSLEVDLKGTQLYISNNACNDHLYAKL